MIDKYALFFDIDGTLVSFNTHEIPASTVRALTEAKENGSQIYIATGRPPMIITNLGQIEHLIDGFITINGALCYIGHEQVCCHPIPAEDVMTCVQDSQAKGYGLIVVMTNEDSPKADNALMAESLSKEIERALSILTDREREIIRMFFGIGCQEATLEDIADKFGLTRERVRQIKERAIRRLRHNQNKSIREYIG